MDARTLRVLEYDKIKALLERHCASSLGKDLARRLQPRTEAAWIADRLAETSEACKALAERGAFPLGGLQDIRGLCRKAQVGAMLDGPELLRVRDVLRVIRLMKAFLPDQDRYPRLAALIGRLGEYSGLERELLRCITDEGQVHDDASPELRRLTDRARTLHDRARARMESILRSPDHRTAIQDPIITMRSGRYCIPVKAERLGALRGIVHDRSASGATLFVEPEPVVEINNEVREVELERDEEVRRILLGLSASVGEQAGEIQADVVTLGQIDFIVAKARLSEALRATEPRLAEAGWLYLRRARHPLLTGDVVPVDLWLGRKFRTLVITGPNTGGKTVTLKTVGLLVLMAQSGLHIPADDGSEVGPFEQVFADIGDEQSIEQSLSTFSSHMTQIVRAVREVGDNALVLLDEIGAGTDPEEGTALAQAILRHLHDRGARTVATTHYSALKAFAYDQPGMENASVEFDPQTLRPTFHLRIGVPGSSNALLIARRLGLPEEILDSARAGLSAETVAVEKAIRRMEKSRRRLDRKRQAVGRDQSRLDDLMQQYEQKLAALNERRRAAMADGFEEAREIVRRAEQRADAILAELRKQPRESKKTQELKRELIVLDEQVRREQAEHAMEDRPSSQRRPVESVRPGDRVYVCSLRTEGEVLSAGEDGQVELQVGVMQMTVDLRDLEWPEEPPGEEARSRRIEIEKSMRLPEELHVLGLTVEEAKLEVDKYLDDAHLAGVPSVRIVHGKGTGALRRGLHEYLRHHPHVKSFALAERHEGGDGVTVVQL
jgi:DNA mismatch repair protein MutS2